VACILPIVRRTTLDRWPRREGREVQTSKDAKQEKPEDPPCPDTDAGQGAGRDEPRHEIGGADGPEPTRYGDWERNGRCTDF